MVEFLSRQEGDRIIIELDPGQPIELGDLSTSFAALARMYERHYRREGEDAPRLYVTKLETGSVLMEIAPLAWMMGAITVMDGGIIVADFTNRIWRAIKAFSSPDEVPKIDPPTTEDAEDIRAFAQPLLGKRGAALGVKHARYEKHDGEKHVLVEYSFDEAELNRAAINIDRALSGGGVDLPLIESPVPKEQIQREVMLFMDQAKRGPGKEKGRTGDRGVIPAVTDKPLPVYFRKSINDLKSQITREVNPLTSTFVVDVHVQLVDGEPRGYIVTAVHEALPGDGD